MLYERSLFSPRCDAVKLEERCVARKLSTVLLWVLGQLTREKTHLMVALVQLASSLCVIGRSRQLIEEPCFSEHPVTIYGAAVDA